MYGRGIFCDIRGLRLAQVQRDILPPGGVFELCTKLRDIVRQVPVCAAEGAVVQREHKARVQLVNEAHERLRFRQRFVELRAADVDGEGPLDLLVSGRTVEIARVVQKAVRTLEPALVQPCAVRVDAGDEVPREACLSQALRVRAEDLAHGGERHRTDGLVGVRAGKAQRVLFAVAEDHGLDRMALPGNADDLRADHVRIGTSQTVDLRVELVYGIKCSIIRD